MKLLKLFVVLALLATASCTTMYRTSDFPLMIQLPASKECFEIKVMSGQERRYSVAECERVKERAILLTSEAWKMIKGDIQTNCQFAQCRQIEGAADGLFLSIDRALNQVPF